MSAVLHVALQCKKGDIIVVRHPSRSLLSLLAAVLLALASVAVMMPAALAQGGETKVTLVHLSDYHSHAVPFYSEGKANQAGIARGIGYLKQAKAGAPNPIILSGGDMMNAGSPSWSDKYQYTEMGWLNGRASRTAKSPTYSC
jgi:2',3'-cyclic-nucleotide 2'-phosphodiesterase (5'-nucleotidase family)